VAVGRDAARAELTMSDTGLGVPDYALGRVFEPFFFLQRTDMGRKNSGLGLTVVRDVALLHGGEARLENRPEGGARATLRLPLNARPDASA
jgi:two-component system sensor histidine kinase CreC